LLASPRVASLRPHLVLHAQIWRNAHKNVGILETELHEALSPFTETIRRLQTVPGVGLVVSASFLAALGTPDRFPDSSHVASYIGLVPATYDSGEAERHGRITKRGSAELRAMLCEAAHHTANPKHPLNPYFTRICARHGYKKAIVTLAQRLARILYQMWRKGEDFDPTQLNVVATRQVRTRTLYWRRGKTTDPQRSPLTHGDPRSAMIAKT
jgi:transposase